MPHLPIPPMRPLRRLRQLRPLRPSQQHEHVAVLAGPGRRRRGRILDQFGGFRHHIKLRAHAGEVGGGPMAEFGQFGVGARGRIRVREDEGVTHLLGRGKGSGVRGGVHHEVGGGLQVVGGEGVA